MQFQSFTHPVTGLAVALGSLRTAQSCGIGEFLDLIPLADFCKKTGLDIIQLLPVNDTGTESSPYSALSAFALNPVYIRLQELPEAKAVQKEITQLHDSTENTSRFNYLEIRTKKNEILRKMFASNKQAILNDPLLEKWILENAWIQEYAVFMDLKKTNFDAGWKSWEKMRTPTHAEITQSWTDPKHKADNLFFAWVQMHLDHQFSQASAYLQSLSIALKGDIPIMMNEDSCDAWANPEFFRDDLRAGSPPDASNFHGQNWGFPIYNWNNLEQTDYAWWKKRLQVSAKYYNAYRIDHILGFFRIWSIPVGEYSGFLGWTLPHEPITTEELVEKGFSGDRLRWICQPHVPTQKVEEVLNNDYLRTHGVLHTIMDRIGNEELWLFKPSIHCEDDIARANLPEQVKEVLQKAWLDRMILISGRDAKGKNLYTPVWSYESSSAWRSLCDEEQNSLRDLFLEKQEINERLWKKQAITLLTNLTSCTDMLACAEDLGSIPKSVPDVLASLSIYGLKVLRWERDWEADGKPFKPHVSCNPMSVATSSVHDSSTLHGWWEQEDGAKDFLNYRNPVQDGIAAQEVLEWKQRYTSRTAAWFLKVLSETSSALLILPIQDILALSQRYISENADSERINIPGTVSAFNWTYRIPASIEQLQQDNELVSAISEVFSERRHRKTN